MEDLRAVVAAGDIVWALDFDGAAWRSADDRSSTALPFVGPGTGVAARDIAWTKAGYVMIGGNGDDGSQGPLV